MINWDKKYAFSDKDKRLEPGPWQDEPDIGITTFKGYRIFIRRSWVSSLCGYIAVPEGHPWHGKNCKDAIFNDLEVHGGLTFSEPDPEDGQWILGFDCGHPGDFRPTSKPVASELNELCEKYAAQFLRGTYKDFRFVELQLIGLVEQAERAKSPSNSGTPPALSEEPLRCRVP